ncbi:myelin-associated glycoprotein-like isoform X2 [Electrophorus electricus]|uniref:myelin-associated glycoprotein-like isoform X2 n=1 Tax=Electrophorus electricus TaxID=8005 RepID=UPI0015CFBB93|nr:myelin-associated glycoprotein-like isoform X2 [Electrophorus electricus]
MHILVSPIESDSWRVKIPPLMVGLEGSCVVIPCHFNYPGPSKKASDFTGIWLTDFNEKVFHSVTSKISQMFQGRTSLTGDLSHRNCSLKINPLHHTDKGTFMFRIEIEDYNKYSFTQSKVSLLVKDSPARPTISSGMEMRSGKKVTTSCSVSHSCPSDPPHITWNYRGILNSQSQEQTKGQWTMTSTLSFIPSKVDHNQPLICTAEFPGGKRVNIQTTLNVKYPPQIEVASSCTSAILVVTCLCKVNSHPASYIKWWGSDPSKELHNTSIETNGSLTIGTLQGILGFTDTVHCSASNSEGSSTLTLQVPHNGNLIYISLAVSALVVTITGISIWIMKRKCRIEQNATHLKTEMNVTPSQADSQRKCEDSPPNYKGTQHVYSNMALDVEDNPYECATDDAIYANI